MSCHDAVDGSQAEAGAFAGAFGCEKWLEKMLACTLVHPTAVVAHGEEYAGKGWSTCLRESRSRDALKFTVAGFDDNAAAVRQGKDRMGRFAFRPVRRRGCRQRKADAQVLEHTISFLATLTTTDELVRTWASLAKL